MPMVVFVITFANDKTKNNNHGTIFSNPENPCFASIVPVKFAITIAIKRNVTGGQTSSIIPAIVATKMIIMCIAFSDNPGCDSKNDHANVANATTIKRRKNFMFLFKNDSLKNVFMAISP